MRADNGDFLILYKYLILNLWRISIELIEGSNSVKIPIDCLFVGVLLADDMGVVERLWRSSNIDGEGGREELKESEGRDRSWTWEESSNNEHRDIVHTDFDRDNEFADDIQVAIHIDEVSLCKE